MSELEAAAGALREKKRPAVTGVVASPPRLLTAADRARPPKVLMPLIMDLAVDVIGFAGLATGLAREEIWGGGTDA